MIFATSRLLVILFFRALGLLVFCFSKKRRAIALKNINLCFPCTNKLQMKKNKKIARDSFIYLAHSLADFLLLKFYNKKNMNRYFEIKNFDSLQESQRKNKGVILATAHFGSWEVAAHFLALNNLKSLILYNPIKDHEWLEKSVKNNRERSGNVLIKKENSLIVVCRRLKKAKMVLFAADQYCTAREGGFVDLFGNRVRAHSGFIKLSLKMGAPIVPGFTFIKGLFKYELRVFDPLYPEDFKKLGDPEYEMAQAFNNCLEKAIKDCPALWMWQHRRFKGLIEY